MRQHGISIFGACNWDVDLGRGILCMVGEAWWDARNKIDNSRTTSIFTIA